MVIPLVKTLQSRDDCAPVVMGLTTAREVLERESIECFSYRDFPLNSAVREYGMKLAADLPGGSPIPLEESVAYLGVSYKNLVDCYGEEGAAAKYANEGRQAFLPVKVMEKVIADGNYDLVIATNSPRTEQAAIIAAGNMGVPSICMVDLFGLQEMKWLSRQNYAKKICVISEYVKSMLVKAGRKPSDIIVTGNPAFDVLANKEYKIKGRRLREAQGWENKKVILWCSQPEPEKHPFKKITGDPDLPYLIDMEMEKTCRRHAKDNWHLVVRLHPNESVDTRKRIDYVQYDFSFDLPVLLNAVDVVVVTSSTVGLQAALLGVPVLALGMSIFSQDAPYEELGIAKSANTFSEIDAALEDIVNGNWVPELKVPVVGSATQNIISVIDNLLF